jgi:fatty-acid desaturase
VICFLESRTGKKSTRWSSESDMGDRKFTPEEIENSKRIFKSATPKYTVDWYIKWVASIIILASMAIRGIPDLVLWDLGLGIIGVVLWLIVSIMWKDRALILVNGVGLMLLINTVSRMLLN